MNFKSNSRYALLSATALASLAMLPGQALAQSSDENVGLEEIIVTAQKREQSVQDVPIAVTAVTQESLEANRITTVNDLSSVAPGVIVKPSAGGIQVPTFTIRGQQSYGVVEGSDKQVSIYLDGVYLGAPRGSIFDLPDIARLEVLRGPQGTLFGRNATAGAVSVVTRDPSGIFGGKLQGTYGNRDQYRVRASIETPEIGPFSAYFSFQRTYKRGDVRNAAAGLPWDRSLSIQTNMDKVDTSAPYLGTVDSNSYFAAVKFESGDFKLIYKYDRNDDNGTGEASSLIAYDRTWVSAFGAAGAALYAPFLNALYDNQNIYLNPTNKRPDVVSNGWTVPRQQKVYGHNLTATWQASESITVKNTFAYRQAFVFSSAPLTGVDGLLFTPQSVVPFATLTAFTQIGRSQGACGTAISAATAQAQIPCLIGQFSNYPATHRWLGVASNATSLSKQYSDEIQINYTSDKLNITVGGVWFKSESQSGGPEGLQNTFSLRATPAQITLGSEGRSFSDATSIAGYAQLEYKVTPELELVLGGRVTHDDKGGRFRYDTGGGPSTSITLTPVNYKKTLGNYLIGVNYKPNDDTLLYAKYSTSFVSGGNNNIGLFFPPEQAKSWEAGLKADFMDRKLRTNLAVFLVNYTNFQQPSSAVSNEARVAVRNRLLAAGFTQATVDVLVGPVQGGVVSTWADPVGDVRATGFEAEITAAPARGLTMGLGLGYTDTKFTRVDPIVFAANGNEYVTSNRPKWTYNMYANYETQPLWGDATLSFRVDGLGRSSYFFSSRPVQDLLIPTRAPTVVNPADFKVNGRIALKNIAIGGTKAEIALWGRNIFDRSSFNSTLNILGHNAVTYDPARSFGVDLGISF